MQDASETFRFRIAWLPYALLLAITAALYGASLYYQFVWDDVAYVIRNYRVQGFDWMHLRAIWTNTYLGHYAPVQHTYLAAIYEIFGLDPVGFHLGQLLTHSVVVCLIYRLVDELEQPGVALAASLLYAVHPTNIETVAWVSESKSTLSFLFCLLSFLFFIQMRKQFSWGSAIGAGLCLALSLLAKINTVVLPAIFLLYDYKQGATWRTLRWKSLLPYFLISGLMTLIHLRAFHGSTDAMESQYLGGPAVHIMNIPLFLSFYIDMTIWPRQLSAWQMFPTQFNFTWIVGLAWLGMIVGGVLSLRAGRDVKFWGLWFVLFLLPVLHLIPFPIWVADRYLYIPLVGGLVLIAKLAFWSMARLSFPAYRHVLSGAFLLAVSALGWKTHRHLPIWKDDLSLWATTTQTCQTSSYCHLNLGLALLRNGQVREGVAELITSVELRPTARNLERLGDAFSLGVHDYPQAVRAYGQALELSGAGHPGEVYGKLARAYYLAKNLPEAGKVVERGKQISPGDVGVWIVDGFVLWRTGRNQEARNSLRRALAMTGGTVNSAAFFTEFMGSPAEVGKMLADLRKSQ